MRSWQSVAFEKFLRLRGTKKKFQHAQLMDDFIASKYNDPAYQLDESYRVKQDILKNEINGMRYYTINEQRQPEKVIYYFHGGAYINDPLSFHWRYLVKLARTTEFTIVVPIYPKLPRYTVVECYEAIHALYDRLLEKYDTTFLFMGDSAGGGLALGLAQDVKRLGKKQPQHVILHSAWLDVTGEDPRYEHIEKLDPMLGVQGAQRLGKMWAKTQGSKITLLARYTGSFTISAKSRYLLGRQSSYMWMRSYSSKKQSNKAWISIILSTKK